MNLAELDTLIRRRVPEDEPGVAMAVLKRGQTLGCHGYGLANLEWQQPITPQTVFGLSSTTKPFTAPAIKVLEQQSKLHLDTPIQADLPEYPTGEHHVILRHLLTHIMILPKTWTGSYVKEAEGFEREEDTTYEHANRAPRERIQRETTTSAA